jgi:hypothetical protein
VRARIDLDDSAYTECDGMDALEAVREKQLGAREPLRSRLAEIERMLLNPSMTMEQAEDAGFRKSVAHWNEVAHLDQVERYRPPKNW